MTSELEDKRMIATEFMGFDLTNTAFLMNKYCIWYPENGGEDLWDVIKRLNALQISEVYEKINIKTEKFIWGFNPANAETIWNAIVQVIKESEGK